MCAFPPPSAATVPAATAPSPNAVVATPSANVGVTAAVIVIILLLLVAAAGVAVWYFFFRKKKREKEQSKCSQPAENTYVMVILSMLPGEMLGVINICVRVGVRTSFSQDQVKSADSINGNGKA